MRLGRTAFTLSLIVPLAGCIAAPFTAGDDAALTAPARDSGTEGGEGAGDAGVDSASVDGDAGGADVEAIDGGGDVVSDSGLDGKTEEAGSKDAQQDAPPDVGACPPMPTGHACTNGLAPPAEYNISTSSGACAGAYTTPPECMTGCTYTCACIVAHLVSPCNGGQTMTCSPVDPSGGGVVTIYCH